MSMQFTFNDVDSEVLTILVVDDMEANRAVLARRLEKFGFAVISVDGGKAALGLLAQSVPDIILLDYMMPHMNGIEVLHELRGNPATKDVPVIMVTARAEGEATIEALAAGADDYVTKPIDFEVLRARIETHLSKRTDTGHLRRANAVLDERVTLRSMALADLEGELKEEIRRRQELERQLQPQSGDNPARSVDRSILTDLAGELESKFDSIFTAVISGKTVNLAQMAEFKELIVKVRKAASNG
jgi:DNA-binding response OmpR family regulator